MSIFLVLYILWNIRFNDYGNQYCRALIFSKKDLEGHSVLMCFDKGCRSSEVSTTEGAFEVNLAIFTASWDLQDLSVGVGEQGSEPWYVGNRTCACQCLQIVL